MKTKTETKTYTLDVVPIAKVSAKELATIIQRARCKLSHDDWVRAREDAQTLSGTGGVQCVRIITVTVRTQETEKWVNERLAAKHGRPVHYTTKREAKKL